MIRLKQLLAEAAGDLNDGQIMVDGNYGNQVKKNIPAKMYKSGYGKQDTGIYPQFEFKSTRSYGFKVEYSIQTFPKSTGIDVRGGKLKQSVVTIPNSSKVARYSTLQKMTRTGGTNDVQDIFFAKRDDSGDLYRFVFSLDIVNPAIVKNGPDTRNKRNISTVQDTNTVLAVVTLTFTELEDMGYNPKQGGAKFTKTVTFTGNKDASLDWYDDPDLKGLGITVPDTARPN